MCHIVVTSVKNKNKSPNRMPVELKFNYEETAAAMDKFIQQDIDELCEWTKNLDEDKYVPKDLTDKQLVLFYNSCYGDLEKTKQCIENYYDCRRNTPEIFNNREFTEKDIKVLDVIRLSIFPGKSCEGDDIVYFSLFDDDYKKFDLESVCKLIYMTVDLYLSFRGPQSGYMFVIDTPGVRLMHLTRMNLSLLRKCSQYLQTALPVRLRAIHMLNANSIIDKIMSLMKPFFDKKFMDIIHFHKKDEDLELLYKVIPKSSLPSNYGGGHPDVDTLHAENTKQLELLQPYFEAEEEQRTLCDKKGKN